MTSITVLCKQLCFVEVNRGRGKYGEAGVGLSCSVTSTAIAFVEEDG
jgi:hypothetical protein